MKSGQIVVIVSGFPRRSETFALNELLGLEARGALARVFATKPGDGAGAQPGAEQLAHRVEALPESGPFELADEIVERLKGHSVAGIHGYFAHRPAEVAERVAARLGIPFGFSAHARDARKVSPEQLGERARRATCVIACNSDVAREFDRSGAKIHLIPHGVDLARFRPRPLPRPEPVRLLAVGRLVEKKGFHVLVDAVARLDAQFHLRIVGEGPERARLAAAIAWHHLGERVTLCGARTHEDLPEVYASAHIVVTPSIEDRSGDRDGLPNVVLEAMASGRAIVASKIGAIASAVAHEETGVHVPPTDAGALASAIESLAHSPARRDALARAARERVERDYDMERSTERLWRLLEVAYA
jgi:glycosyltransferase involved in cell wall biosynthesis